MKITIKYYSLVPHSRSFFFWEKHIIDLFEFYEYLNFSIHADIHKYLDRSTKMAYDLKYIVNMETTVQICSTKMSEVANRPAGPGPERARLGFY